jgi:pentatricopeptide repeat protein
MNKELKEYAKRLKIPGNMVKLIRDVSTVLLTRLGMTQERISMITDQFAKKGEQRMFDALVENALERRRLAREEGIRKGIRLGMDKGRWEEALEIARQMKEDGFSPEQIRKYTGVADPGEAE